MQERADQGNLERQSEGVGEGQINGSATAATQEPTSDFPAGELVAEMRGYLRQNKAWSQREQERDPDFFKALQDLQSPAVMWIGCAETRVPVSANLFVGLPEGGLQRGQVLMFPSSQFPTVLFNGLSPDPSTSSPFQCVLAAREPHCHTPLLGYHSHHFLAILCPLITPGHR